MRGIIGRDWRLLLGPVDRNDWMWTHHGVLGLGAEPASPTSPHPAFCRRPREAINAQSPPATIRLQGHGVTSSRTVRRIAASTIRKISVSGHTGSYVGSRAMIAISFSQGISSAGWTTALCLLFGAVAVWLWLYLASTRPDPALVSLAGPTSDPKRSTQKGVRLQVSTVKNKTDTLEDALEPEEGLTREGGVPLREASSHPEHGQRRKDQTEFDDKSRSLSKDIGFKVSTLKRG
jgi:hypothetical protein